MTTTSPPPIDNFNEALDCANRIPDSMAAEIREYEQQMKIKLPLDRTEVIHYGILRALLALVEEVRETRRAIQELPFP